MPSDIFAAQTSGRVGGATPANKMVDAGTQPEIQKQLELLKSAILTAAELQSVTKTKLSSVLNWRPTLADGAEAKLVEHSLSPLANELRTLYRSLSEINQETAAMLEAIEL
jgi:hypothetical protein